MKLSFPEFNFFANNRVNIDEVYKDTLIEDFPEILGYLKIWICYFFSVLTATQIGVSSIDDYTNFLPL